MWFGSFESVQEVLGPIAVIVVHKEEGVHALAEEHKFVRQILKALELCVR